MKWKRGQGRDQIEDRRGQAAGGVDLGPLIEVGLGSAIGNRRAGGVGGLVMVAVVVVGLLLISGVLGGGGGLGGLAGLGAGGGAPAGTFVPQGDTDEFVAYVVSDVQDFWAETFSRSGRDYPETKLVLFTGNTRSECGAASAATGPFYCPADQKVYLDLGFFDELRDRFGAPGDFAMAYVIAHEFGHHVQAVTGVADAVRQQGDDDPSRRNDLSVRQELQADCLAGVWAHAAVAELEPGDVDEALGAAAAVGDDRIQASTTGRVDPESWTHGSSSQRQAWFSTGYRSGNVADCDTFA